MPGKRILVVDDEPNIVQTCCRHLELHGYEPQGTTNAADALAAYKENAADLVLLDLQMPGTNGLQTLADLHSYDPNAEVVIITGYGSKENVVNALRLGAREFLEKPMTSDDLLAAVDRVFQQHHGKAIRGNLRSLSLPNIIQINCAERHTGRLRLRRRGLEASIFFGEGEVIHALFGGKMGEEAVYELLTWDDGDFELEMGVETPIRTINATWSSLLLEGMRRMDEEHAGDDGLLVLEPKEVTEMSKINDVLREMAAEIPGFMATDVVGMDGVTIAGHNNMPEFSNENASAQFTLVMKLVQKTVQQLGAGEVEDNLVTTNKAYIVTRFLGDNSYYLGIAVDKSVGTLGNVRMVTKQYAGALWNAIPKRG